MGVMNKQLTHYCDDRESRSAFISGISLRIRSLNYITSQSSANLLHQNAIALQKRLHRFLSPLQLLHFLRHASFSAQQLRHVVQSTRQLRQQLHKRLRFLHDGVGGRHVTTGRRDGLEKRSENLDDALRGIAPSRRPAWTV